MVFFSYLLLLLSEIPKRKTNETIIIISFPFILCWLDIRFHYCEFGCRQITDWFCKKNRQTLFQIQWVKCKKKNARKISNQKKKETRNLTLEITENKNDLRNWTLEHHVFIETYFLLTHRLTQSYCSVFPRKK